MKRLDPRVLIASVMLAGCMSPIVGAECREGLTECEGRCVDLSRDQDHCGACGNTCAAGEWCVAATCEDTVSAPDADGGVTADGAWSTDERPARPGHDGGTRVLSRGCGLGELACGGTCVNADSDHGSCGACGNRCGADEVCAAGRCSASCELPLVLCDGSCIDTEEDANHCGGCGMRCESGICREGMCQAPLAGHLVVIGHDYLERRSGMSRLVGNAAFLPTEREVRVLVFEGQSLEATRRGTDAAIDQVATETGRTWSRTATTAGRLTFDLGKADALVLYAQPDVSRADALATGAAWRVALGAFLRSGGTLVALVGPHGDGGTLAILEGADLLDGTPPRTDISGELVRIERAGDALAIGVPLEYRAERSTVRLDLPLEEAVVSDGLAPVVVHHLVLP